MYPDYLKIKYRIVEVDEANQLIIVRYSADWLTEEDLAVDPNRNPDGTPVRCRTDYSINIWDHIQTQEDIENLMASYIPIDWFKLQYIVHNQRIDHTVEGRLSHLKLLLNRTFEKDVKTIAEEVEIAPQPVPQQPKMLSNFYEELLHAPKMSHEEIDELLKKIK